MTIKAPKQVEDALRDPSSSAFIFLLSVDDLEVGDLITQGEWGQGEDGAIYTNLSLADKLPVDYYDTPSAFAIAINGDVVPQMAGLTSLPTINEDKASTNFLAASALSLAGDTPFDEDAPYPGVTPEYALKDIVRRLPYYRGASQIEPVREPLLYLSYLPEDHVGDLVNEIEGQTFLKVRDNALGGMTANHLMEPNLFSVKDYRIWNAADFIKWRPPPRVERRYSEVVVYGRGEGGGYAFPPARAKVDYPRQRNPIPGAKHYIALDTLGPGAPQRARNLARDWARRFGRGVFKDDSAILPTFDPLLEMQDTFIVYEIWEDLKGLWDRMWLCWVDAFKHQKETLETAVSYSAALMQNDLIVSPGLAMAGISASLPKFTVAFCDVVGDEMVLDVDNLDWVIVEGDEFVFAQDAPEVEVDGDEIVITCSPLVPCGEDYDGNLFLLSSLEWVMQSGEDILIDLDKAGASVYEDGEGIVIECPDRAGPLWGELIPYELVIDESVPWAWIEGDEWVIDTEASGGHAWVEGDEVVISQ